MNVTFFMQPLKHLQTAADSSKKYSDTFGPNDSKDPWKIHTSLNKDYTKIYVDS